MHQKLNLIFQTKKMRKAKKMKSLAEFNSKVEILVNKVEDLQTKSTTLESTVTQLTTKNTTLESTVADLKTNVKELKERLDCDASLANSVLKFGH